MGLDIRKKKLLLHNIAGCVYVGALVIQIGLGAWAVNKGFEAFDQVEILESELASKSEKYVLLEERIKELTQENETLLKENEDLKAQIKELEKQEVEENNKTSLGQFRISFYDTTQNSQEGWGYQTASGVSLKGKNLYDRLIAVPPHIPLGSKLYLEFKDNPELNGIYTGVDRGGGIKGNKIDVFYEDYNMEGSAMDMGIKYADVYLIGE